MSRTAGRWLTAVATAACVAGSDARAQTAAPIRAIAFRDGGHVVAASDDAIEIWQIGARHPLRSTAIDPGLSRAELALSPNGRLLAAHRLLKLPLMRAIAAISGPLHDTRLVDVETEREIALPGSVTGTPAGLAFSSDGSLLIRLTLQDEQLTFDIWRVPTADRIATGAVAMLSVAPAAVAIDPAGERFALLVNRNGGGVQPARQILLCNAGTGAVLETIDTSAAGLLFSPDRRLLHFAEAGPIFAKLSALFRVGAAGDRTIRIWDVASGAVLTSAEALGAVRSLAVSPDGRFIAAGTALGLQVFDFSAGGLKEVPRDAPSALPARVPEGQFGAGAYYPRGSITAPVPLWRAAPKYSSAAMRAKIEGIVILDVVVNADGRPGQVRVARSLDRTHGLDDAAIAAAREWRFKPAHDADGVPVPVIVTIQLEFRLH